MTKLFGEIVIPVHDESRPIRRAAETVLQNPEFGVIVIAHNISPELLDLPQDERLRVVELAGFAGYPGACFDLGIKEAKAEWVGIMGSDDWFEPNALSVMKQRALKDKADIVITPQRQETQFRNAIRPLTLRTKGLQAARDRMFYRTAPLGIYKREILKNPRYEFGAVFPQGSDMRVSAALWNDGLKVSYYWNDPAYIVGRGAKTRVTFTPRPLAVSGAPYLALFDEDSIKYADQATKRAFAVKMVRIHVMSAAILRPQKDNWNAEDLAWLSNYLKELKRYDAGFEKALSLKELRIVKALQKQDVDALVKAVAAREKRNPFLSMLTKNPLDMFLQHDSLVRWGLVTYAALIKSKLGK